MYIFAHPLPSYECNDTRAEINLGKYLGPMQFIDQLIDMGNGVLVLDSVIIQGPVVYAHSHCSILILH